MKFEDLVKIYEEKKKKRGIDTYKHIYEVLKEAKIIHMYNKINITENGLQIISLFTN